MMSLVTNILKATGSMIVRVMILIVKGYRVFLSPLFPP